MIDGVIIFTLDEQRFGLPLQGVAQVIRAVEVAPLPQGPATVLGVITLQGIVTPVLSLRRLLRLPESEIKPDNQFIILAGQHRIALVVDAVREVMDDTGTGLTVAENSLPGVESMKGTLRTRDGTILIRDLDLFLSFSGEESPAEVIPASIDIPAPPLPVQTGFDVIVFTLLNERYGIETAHVREVIPAMEVTPIPCAPQFVVGVISVRGDILAVIDLKTYFELPVTEPSRSGEVIIVEAGDSLFGILADSTLGVSFVSLSDFQRPSPGLSGIRAGALRGLTKEQLLVLDMPGMLADKKLWVHEEVAV